jgi:hypothetical protein
LRIERAPFMHDLDTGENTLNALPLLHMFLTLMQLPVSRKSNTLHALPARMYALIDIELPKVRQSITDSCLQEPVATMPKVLNVEPILAKLRMLNPLPSCT